MEKPTYTYVSQGILWAIVKWKYMPFGRIGETIYESFDKEDVIAKVEKLNSDESLLPVLIYEFIKKTDEGD